MAMELDRLHAVKADLAEENLARGFTGKLQDAHCSVEEDAEQILEQLRESGHEKEVEVPCNECMLNCQKVCSSQFSSKFLFCFFFDEGCEGCGENSGMGTVLFSIAQCIQ